MLQVGVCLLVCLFVRLFVFDAVICKKTCFGNERDVQEGLSYKNRKAEASK